MSHNRQLTDERLKIWLDFSKWLISVVVITGGLSVATIMINAKHKDIELEIKINQEEKEYLTSFLERALDDNLEKRKRFAQYFASVTTSKKYQNGWKHYLKTINDEFDKVKEEKDKLLKEIPNKSGKELEQAKKRIAELESELLRSTSSRSRSSETHQFDYPFSLSIYENIVIIGTPENNYRMGSAYIFIKKNNRWVKKTKLMASDAEPSDRFGFSVSISGDTAIVGAPSEDSRGMDAGAAYIFQKNHEGENNWRQAVKLSASDAEPSDRFGFSVSISGDTAIVTTRSQKIYTFKQDNNGIDMWGEIRKISK